MQVSAEMILGDFGTKLPLDRRRKDALAEYARKGAWADGARSVQRWLEDKWDLKSYEAKDLVAGNSSEAIYERIKKHPNGDWPVILAVEGSVVGQSLDDWLKARLVKEQERLRREREQFELQERQLEEMGRRAAALAGLFVGLSGEPVIREGRESSEHGRPVGAEQDRKALTEPATFSDRTP